MTGVLASAWDSAQHERSRRGTTRDGFEVNELGMPHMSPEILPSGKPVVVRAVFTGRGA